MSSASSVPRAGRAAAVAFLLALLVAIANTSPAAAHAGNQSYLYLDVGSELDARLQMPFTDVEEALGVDFGNSTRDADAAITANAELLRSYAAEHVAIGSATEFWKLTPTAVTRVGDAPYVQVAFDVDHGEDIPDELVVELDPFFDEIADRDALLLIANDWTRGVVDNEADSIQRFTPGQRRHSVTFGDSSQWTNLTSSVELGIDHIRTGPDHMLFIVALLLPSVLMWRQLWLPADGFGQSLWRITKIMTMFTLAHSITFTLTGLELVPAPGPKVTETVIALSIAATALHNLRPVFVNREWLIALLFGLFHGFGFASLVQDLEVSNATQLVSLAGRNIGIEIGQVAVVLLTFPGLFLLRRTRFYRPFFVTGSVLLIAVSLGWAVERTVGGKTFTTKLVNKVTDFPQVLGLLFIFTALATAAHLWERAHGSLEPTASELDPERSLDDELSRV